jgi:hypothetical protein
VNLDYYAEQVAIMVKRGRSPEWIAQRLGKTVQWVMGAAQHPDVIKRCTQLRQEEMQQEEPEMWDRERYSLEIQGWGPEMIREARRMAMDPKVSDATRMKAIETVLKYNENMPTPKDAVNDAPPGVMIDGPIAERLLDLVQSRQERARLLAEQTEDYSA